MTDPIGPTMAGGHQPIDSEDGYRALFYPDANNYELMREGKNPVYYWVPDQLRIARHGGEKGDYKFSLLRFAGGAGAVKPTVGGVLGLTTTGSIPAAAMERLQKKLIEKITSTSSNNGLWNPQGREPMFRPVTLLASTASISDLKFTQTGLRHFVQDKKTKKFEFRTSGMLGKGNREKIVKGPTKKDEGIGDWYWVLQGAGAASMDPTSEHAFTALLGRGPAAILYDTFKGASTVIYAGLVMDLQMWTPKIELSVKGEWKKIYDHFSAHANAHNLWTSADIRYQLNHTDLKGKISVEISPIGSFPGSADIAKYLRDKSDLVLDRFTQEAQRIIFDPAPVDETAAEASSSGAGASPWGVAFALKKRIDETELDLAYKETMQFSHVQQTVVSSSLQGLLHAMATEENAEGKYFPSVNLDDWPKELARTTAPIASWQTKLFHSLSVQIGYPDKSGALLWKNHVFTAPNSSTELENWTYTVFQKAEHEVENPPAGWKPDRTFVKRAIHFNEPDPYDEFHIRRITVPEGMLQLDKGDNGTPLNDSIVEVRAQSNTIMAVPVHFRGVLKENQEAELTVQAVDEKNQPIGEEARFYADAANLRQPRSWTLCPAPSPSHRYQYKVTVYDWSDGSEWGSKRPTISSGPLRAPILPKNSQNVTFRFRERQK
ncbi:hypothetical protein AB0A77_02925 [Streptomyces varsoviensis]|uniref:hypothetical protein n=1 Tax=Streptomyces varsoviensis TaxID=67373 RepID=UPI0033D3ACA5